MLKDGDSLQSTNTTTVGRYHLLRRIGRGGMGEVWLGEDPRLHRQIAIKTLPLHSQNDREFLQRFEREARAAAALPSQTASRLRSWLAAGERVRSVPTSRTALRLRSRDRP